MFGCQRWVNVQPTICVTWGSIKAKLYVFFPFVGYFAEYAETVEGENHPGCFLMQQKMAKFM
jgi:hypothetical protein